jgi:hypothetical protein
VSKLVRGSECVGDKRLEGVDIINGQRLELLVVYYAALVAKRLSASV